MPRRYIQYWSHYPLERDRATSQEYLLPAGTISGHSNRLAAEIKSGTTAREIVERDALKAREGRQLIDPEGAAAVERQHVGAGPAGQTVPGIERIRRPVRRVVASSAGDRVRSRRQGKNRQGVTSNHQRKAP